MARLKAAGAAAQAVPGAGRHPAAELLPQGPQRDPADDHRPHATVTQGQCRSDIQQTLRWGYIADSGRLAIALAARLPERRFSRSASTCGRRHTSRQK
jgi:hypothetical protein